MITQNAYRRSQRGFSLVEALIALVVVAFGILSLAGMQLLLSRSADVSKQRTEAVRLAQEKIEQLRSFSGISATLPAQDNTNTANVLNWNALASGTDTVTTNTAYSRGWTIGGTSADLSRALTVQVQWSDRAGEAQNVALSTVISKTDPADSGFLGFPLPQNTNLKRPKNRNLDIPIPAIDLGNGRSAVGFGTNGQYLQFSNISGDVVYSCTPTGLGANPTTAQIIAALTDTTSANCSTVNGYILAGYVGRDASVSNTDWNAIQGGLGLDVSGITRNAAGSSGISCQFGDATDQTSGAMIANYKYYICVIPLAVPSTPLNANGPYNWSGTVRIAGPAVWHGANNKYYVCRYQYSTTSVLSDPNQRNVQPYVEVNKSIDQQNYLIVTTANATSTTAPACPASMTTTDISSGASISTGVLHQDCRSASNPVNYGTACPLFSTTQTTYAVTYNANGATGGTAPVDPQSPYTNGSTVTVLGNSGNLVLTGKTFSGWNTAADGTGTTYQAGATISNISANTTLYAKWTTAATYSITYDANGGTGTLTDPNSPYSAGSNVVILNGTTLVRSGYTFTGWNTAANGSGTTYLAGATLTGISANTLLYAQWSQISTFTVTYNSNGSTSGTAPTDATAYASGSTVTVKTGADLMKTGYSFNGWNTAANGSGTAYAVNATFTISSNTTLYASWTQLKLATPAPVWPASGTDPRTLGWAAVPSATGYIVTSCSVINSGSTSSCTPNTAASQAGASVTPPSMGTKDTWCYNVIATGSPYANSLTSATKCVNRAANGNYSYN